ncbi:unnamed protein product [Rotaria magnacalcarata]|uniref:Uncharacterized protein n=1 Tax=Rotaria magnacalcarata TaxID=392030 RepID=A0A816Y2K6_9BILA|nr:unnamed protein product [Rotaria magnacalcarata]CAF4244461.1 unnamed protein product [Rotaria magnacalcarata]CAF4795690.1 unnamed protein product [Rotaria magnacalcarata]CAF5221732.1 unnamed protein product [Rotaria magnacalcarata]
MKSNPSDLPGNKQHPPRKTPETIPNKKRLQVQTQFRELPKHSSRNITETATGTLPIRRKYQDADTPIYHQYLPDTTGNLAALHIPKTYSATLKP